MFNFIVQNEFDVLLLICQNLSKIQKMLRKRKGYGVHTCIYIYMIQYYFPVMEQSKTCQPDLPNLIIIHEFF